MFFLSENDATKWRRYGLRKTFLLKKLIGPTKERV